MQGLLRQRESDLKQANAELEERGKLLYKTKVSAGGGRAQRVARRAARLCPLPAGRPRSPPPARPLRAARQVAIEQLQAELTSSRKEEQAIRDEAQRVRMRARGKGGGARGQPATNCAWPAPLAPTQPHHAGAPLLLRSAMSRWASCGAPRSSCSRWRRPRWRAARRCRACRRASRSSRRSWRARATSSVPLAACLRPRSVSRRAGRRRCETRCGAGRRRAVWGQELAGPGGQLRGLVAAGTASDSCRRPLLSRSTTSRRRWRSWSGS
jgi:hypothetical protein